MRTAWRRESALVNRKSANLSVVIGVVVAGVNQREDAVSGSIGSSLRTYVGIFLRPNVLITPKAVKPAPNTKTGTGEGVRVNAGAPSQTSDVSNLNH